MLPTYETAQLQEGRAAPVTQIQMFGYVVRVLGQSHLPRGNPELKVRPEGGSGCNRFSLRRAIRPVCDRKHYRIRFSSVVSVICLYC